ESSLPTALGVCRPFFAGCRGGGLRGQRARTSERHRTPRGARRQVIGDGGRWTLSTARNGPHLRTGATPRRARERCLAGTAGRLRAALGRVTRPRPARRLAGPTGDDP